MPLLNPYLFFDGTCESAFAFYKSVFGGEFAMFSRFSEIPDEVDMKIPKEAANRVMHVALPLSDEAVLMGSDSMPGSDVAPSAAVSISYQPDTEAEARRVFEALSAGGKVTMEMEQTFWGALFGRCTDRFGIRWLVNYDMGAASS